MSEHRCSIRMSESCVDPNPLMVERQDPDNFTRFQTQERCALEIAAYVFKLVVSDLRSATKILKSKTTTSNGLTDGGDHNFSDCLKTNKKLKRIRGKYTVYIILFNVESADWSSRQPCDCNSLWIRKQRNQAPKLYTICMLNSTEHAISTAH